MITTKTVCVTLLFCGHSDKETADGMAGAEGQMMASSDFSRQNTHFLV